MNAPQIQIYEFDEFRVDAAKRLLTKGIDETIPLTPKVFDTLLYLVKNGGKVIEKDELMREIWTDSVVEENNLSQNISILRRVFGEKPGEQRFIVTVPGHGFRFVPEVTLISDSGFGIADVKPKEMTSENKTEKTENQITEDEAQKIEDKNPVPNPKDQKPFNFRFAAFTILSILVIAAIGFYLWR